MHRIGSQLMADLLLSDLQKRVNLITQFLSLDGGEKSDRFRIPFPFDFEWAATATASHPPRAPWTGLSQTDIGNREI